MMNISGLVAGVAAKFKTLSVAKQAALVVAVGGTLGLGLGTIMQYKQAAPVAPSRTGTASNSGASADSAQGTGPKSNPKTTAKNKAKKSSKSSKTAAASASGSSSSATASSPTSTSYPTCPNTAAGYCRPFGSSSPWNTPIASNVALDPASSTYINAISNNNKPLTADSSQYTIAMYLVNSKTTLRTVHMNCYYSTYDGGDNSRVGHGCPAGDISVPVPTGAVSSPGSDGQITFWDPVTGTEYGFWQFESDSPNHYVATNGWRYHTTSGYNGRFADGLSGRGAGTPYSAGLIRPWEMSQGHISHALAFAYSSPAPTFRYPASKSDGDGVSGVDAPEGARLQLNPALTDANFNSYGLSAQAKIIAKAMQQYGMYIIDNSGSSKIYLEADETAHWNKSIYKTNMLSGIPWSQFRVVAAP